MLPRRANFWLKWILPLVGLVVLTMSLVPLRGLPRTTLVGFVRTGVQTGSLVLVPESSGTDAAATGSAAWRMQLRLDPALKAPGPAWILYDGATPGSGGYELHWLPTRLGLQLFRIGEPMLLASATLERLPTEVVFARRGYQLEVSVDGQQMISCLDPLPARPATSCGFSTSGALLDSTFSIYDDRQLIDATTLAGLALEHKDLRPLLDNLARPDVTMLNVRYALSLDPDKAPAEMLGALERAGAAVRALGAQHPDRIHLQHWLAWGEARLAFALQDGDAAQRAGAAFAQLVELGEQQPSPENLGLLFKLLNPIAAMCAQSPYRAPTEVLRWRRAWFDLLAYAADQADAACSPEKAVDGTAPAIGDDWRWQLRLLAHGAECLRGPLDAGRTVGDAILPRPPWPRPTPAEAPEWVVCRWRAFAGGDPGEAGFAGDIPIAQDERNPIRPALIALIHAAGFEPEDMPAVHVTANIIKLLDTALPTNASAEGRRANEQLALEAARTAPVREAALDQALLTLHGIGDANAALAQLDPDPKHLAPVLAGKVPLARSDPLAYALYRLIQHRQAEQNATSPANPLGKPEDLPDQLTPFARLLGGKPEATYDAWLVAAKITPSQMMAAALAMQEVVGLHGKNGESAPDWRILDQLPCYTLPLRLMKRAPPGATQPTSSGTPKPTVP